MKEPHGDLKPENVLLRPNNRAFLCDLGGSATFEQHLTQTTGEFGTFEYNSPERVMDSKGLATPANDVWSLGVLAYRMVTGKSLFEGLTLPQLCLTLGQFNESRISTTILPCVREVLLKMLEPNVALRTTTTALFEGGLLERMLGSETPLSKMKGIQLATRVNEIKESFSDAKVKEKTMELEMERQKLLDETKELESKLRSLQLSLHLTCERNAELKKDEKLVLRQQILATQPSQSSIDPVDNILSTELQIPDLQFHESEFEDNDERSHFDVSGKTITRSFYGKDKFWSTTLLEEPISEGVVSVAITLLTNPEDDYSKRRLMFGLVDALSRQIEPHDQLGVTMPNSIALFLKKRRLHVTLPSINHKEENCLITARIGKGDRVVLEVDMDARPRTAVFIINGNVCLTFVSGLPPSIRFGFSMMTYGTSIRFEGISRLKRATPLRRVNEIKWNPEDLQDSDDMYMNGMRSSILTVQKQLPSLVFTDPSHFIVEDNIITSTGLSTKKRYGKIKPTWSSFFLPEPITEGIVAISLTYLTLPSKGPNERYPVKSFFGLIDGTAPIPEKGQKLGKVQNSIALSTEGDLHFMTEKGQEEIDISSLLGSGCTVVVEINMDSNPRTVQFFVNGKTTNTVVLDLPESIRVGFSTKGFGVTVRFDRITNLNYGSPISDQMSVFGWPTYQPPEKSEDMEEKGLLNEEKSHSESDRESKDDQPSEDDLDKRKGKAVEDGREEEVQRDKQESDERKKRVIPKMKLPELIFTNKSHFVIRNNVLTRTEKGTDELGRHRSSTVLISEPITKGVNGFINFGLLDSSAAVPQLGQVLGKDVKNSVGLSTNGKLHFFIQSNMERSFLFRLWKKDRVVMEVNMDSTPRTVQFFFNGQTIPYCVSEIPESVRIGFSADVMGTSLQIASIIHHTQPTPLEDKMEEIEPPRIELPNITVNENNMLQTLRESEWWPYPSYRNQKHFTIEGNVITRTDFDSTEFSSPFSTVMFLEGPIWSVRSVTITILALPQTERSYGVVMIGCLRSPEAYPKNTHSLGYTMDTSYALCSIDGLMHFSDGRKTPKERHTPLEVGDQVTVVASVDFLDAITRFYVNGKAVHVEICKGDPNRSIGFSLAGPGTSIRIDNIEMADVLGRVERESSECLCRIL
ncbi:putative Protein kinase domain containing protein [Blattamonas nauphoetae]|uniref:Protein kinase domain-containing protein n=1 Tax=Blattamonas nauphoetae TaxID=2049346 RepID=A0ABQ9XSY1_9EUKA|nr:putative Protein kinase domain containing protein [Blattamonas nauphoetae]